MNNLPYIVVFNFLSDQEIDQLIQYWNTIRTVEVLEDNNWDTGSKKINDITVKGRKVRITGVSEHQFESITVKIKKAFSDILGTDSKVEFPHYLTEYKAGCYHASHRDKLPEMWYRDKVITVQLSNPLDYEGGDLMIDDFTVPKDKGCAIIYNGKDYHQVTKVTKGVRFSLTECAGVKPKEVLI